MPADVMLSFTLSPVGTPNQVQLVWQYNTAPPIQNIVTLSPGQTVYNYPFDANNPGITLVNGDTLGLTATPVDTVNNLTGPPTVIAPITIVEAPPPVTPGALTGVSLVQTS